MRKLVLVFLLLFATVATAEKRATEEVRMDDWTRRVDVVRVVDGDTVDVIIDLGYDVSMKARLRLDGIDAPESRGESKVEGLAATEHLRKLVKQNEHTLTMRPPSVGRWKGKFGRPLATLFAGNVNLNEQMIRDGHAVIYNGGKR